MNCTRCGYGGRGSVALDGVVLDETVRVARYWYKTKARAKSGCMRTARRAYVDLRTNERPLRTKSVKADIIKCDVISGAEISRNTSGPGR